MGRTHTSTGHADIVPISYIAHKRRIPTARGLLLTYASQFDDASEARRADYVLTCTHESVEVRSVGGNGCGVCEMRIADMHTN